MPITALYAVPLVLLFLVLTFRTIGYRRSQRISVGDGGDKELQKRMRVHANCAEYVPIGLLVIALAESLSAPAALLHSLGAGLVGGRILHAYGMSQKPQIIQMRVAGMVLTTAVIAAGALIAGWLTLQRLP